MALFYLPFRVQSGGRNMVTDNSLLRAKQPFFRLYGWEPACISLGRYQSHSEGINHEVRRALGIELVRRLSGGGAVLHHHEVTYALGVPESWVPTAVDESYVVLADPLRRALNELGVPAQWTSTSAERKANCFSARASCDLLVEDKKVMGSAQVREDGFILQHGSILVGYDVNYWRVFDQQAKCVVVGEYGVGQAQLIAALERAVHKRWGLQYD